MNEQGKDDIRIDAAVKRAELEAVRLAAGREGNGDEGSAVLVRPGDVLRRFELAEALEGIRERIAEDGHFGGAAQHARDELLTLLGLLERGMEEVFAVFRDRDREMQAAARGVLERFRQEGREQAARGRHGLYDPLEGHEVVRRFERLGGAEIDLVLAGALLMVRGFRLNVHLFERQADLTAHVFRLVERRYIEILAVIVRNGGWMAVFIQLEQVKLACRAHGQRVACAARTAVGLTQQMTAVALERRAVRIANVAVKAHYTALSRPPRQNGKRRRVGKQQQVGGVYVEKAAQRGGIEMNAVLKGAGQLGRLNGNVLLVSENITERQTDEFNVVLLNKLYDFAHGGIHTASLLPYH